MKTVALSLLFAFSAFANAAALDAGTVKKLIEDRQAQMGVKVKASTVSIKEIAEYQGATLYRVTASIGRGEQSYLIRFPLQTPGGLADVILTENESSDAPTAKEYKISEAELATMTQAASEATLAQVEKEIPDSDYTSIFTFANGERYGKSAAVIFTVQVMYKGAPVPLLRRAYVTRKGHKVEVGYDD